MGQLRTVHGAGHWYLVARHGDRVLRVRPRLLLGETAAGELSFDASCAQLELDIDDDGSILLKAVGGHELEWAGGVRCHRERLARNRGAEIRLFHNVLLLDTDFVEEPDGGLPSDEVKEAQIRRFPDLLLENPVDKIVAEPPPASLEPPLPAVEATLPAVEATIPAVEATIPAVDPPPPSKPRPHTHNKRRADPRGQQTNTRSPRVRRASIAGLVGLASIGLAVLYIATQKSDTPETPATVAIAPAPQTDTVRSPSAIVTDAARAAEVKPAPKPAPDAPPSIGVTQPEVTHPERVLAPPPEPASERISTTAALSAPAVASAPSSSAVPPASTSVGPSARPPIATPAPPRTAASKPPPPDVTDATPPASQSSAVASRSTEPASRAPVAPSPSPAVNVATTSQTAKPQQTTGTLKSSPAPVVASQENTAARREAAARQARVRALFAADQALAQGRLVSPPEANAYTLYNRVLALDPESQEAKRGLQSVRAGLINSTLASLAGNALDDARTSLKAAADAGADPMLVANLQSEIEYRQGQALPQQ